MTTARTIDLNADIRERLEAADAAILLRISSASIACGGHAGDLHTMRGRWPWPSRTTSASGRIQATPTATDSAGARRASATQTCGCRYASGSSRSRSWWPKRALEQALAARTWMVSPRAERVGLRLDGERLGGADRLDLVSLPTVPGAVQVPANGQPIVLLPDAPTVGGHPVPAVVAAAHDPRTGQLRPGHELCFRWISLSEARRALARQTDRLADATGALA